MKTSRSIVQSITLCLAGTQCVAAFLFLSACCTAHLRAQCAFPTAIGDRVVTYRFRSEASKTGLILHVTLEFNISPKGIDTLVIPTEYAGEILRGVSYLHTISPGTELLYSNEPGVAIVHGRPGHSVTIAYDLTKDWNGPLVQPLQFHAVIMPQYVEFTGTNALVRLKLQDGVRETANFDWQQLPASWTVATSFGAGATAVDRCQTAHAPWGDIDKGLYAAGDFRLHNFKIGGKPAVLAIRGAWLFSDDKAIEQIQETIGSVRNFWHDDDFPYFLVTLKPYDQEHGSSDGSAFTNGFWMYVSRRDMLDGLLPQLAHESFHAWNPFRMGQYPHGNQYEATKWFKEGFTEYYAQLLTYKSGGLSAESYTHGLNKDLQLFPASSDEYVRGRIIALWLDGTIRKESHGEHSLDDGMRDMVSGAASPYTQARIFATMDHYLTASSRDLLRRAVLDHGELTPPKNLPQLEACAHASLDDIQPFDLGLDFETTQSTRLVTGVTEGGSAYRAGLRNGQSALGWSVVKGNADREVTFTVLDGTQKRQIKYLPRGQMTKIWQYHLDPATPCHVAAPADAATARPL